MIKENSPAAIGYNVKRDSIKDYLISVSDENESGALINMKYIDKLVNEFLNDDPNHLVWMTPEQFLDESPCTDGYLCKEEDAEHILKLLLGMFI